MTKIVLSIVLVLSIYIFSVNMNGNKSTDISKDNVFGKLDGDKAPDFSLKSVEYNNKTALNLINFLLYVLLDDVLRQNRRTKQLF